MNVQILHRSVDEPPTAGSEASVPSLDEITRASRFYFQKDRIHYTRCRSAHRGRLAGCLAIPTSEIRFEHLTSGKPRLAVEQNPGAPQFNASHSVDTPLLAVGSEHQLGVDIEKIRADVDTNSLADRI
jgi:4'-phosphopantetheinyl transferase